MSVVTSADRESQRALNEARSLDEPAQDDHSEEHRVETIADPSPSPLDILLAREEEAELRAVLTPLEESVFDRYAQQRTYAEIGEGIDRTTKAVDNAMIRIRAKAAKLRARE